MTSQEIRQQFIDFFVKKHGHTFVPSSPVVPLDDPTLLFTNAGMNQFKPIFLGQETRSYTRAANTQKCIRAGGKHNDLDDVGRSRRHGTFFEMLGNWSFGDYFKQGAIEMAWELMTKVWQLDRSRLHVTCYEGDEKNGVPRDTEAAEIWKSVAGLPDGHIHFLGKENFWEMGDTGPCGPCTEIYIDRTEDKSGGKDVGGEDPRIMEFWNLVFIQYNRNPDRSLTPLPSQHVDTGMGFERICSILQNKSDMYGIDLFHPFWQALSDISGRKYAGTYPKTNAPDPAAEGADGQLRTDIAFRVVADHIRSLTFALTDGAVPSNEGRGYVLRRILRRAVRFGRQQLELKEPFLHKMVPVVVDAMGGAFPELKKNPQRVVDLIREEEVGFGKTWDRGIRLFENAVISAVLAAFIHREYGPQAKVKAITNNSDIPHGVRNANRLARFEVDVELAPGVYKDISIDDDLSALERSLLLSPISAEDAFKLHDTYGFPIDLTRIMAEERGMTVDLAGYEKLMEQARELARSGGKQAESGVADLPPDAIAKLQGEKITPTNDQPKYAGEPIDARIEAIWNGEKFIDVLEPGVEAAIILNHTNFYAEMGGQVGDGGTLHLSENRSMGVSPMSGGTGHARDAHATEKATSSFIVQTTRSVGGYVLHVGQLKSGTLKPGDSVTAVVAGERALTQKNHTTTHLANWALRDVLGGDVQQKGSLVDPEKLRFDFSHGRSLSEEELSNVETLVNQRIAEKLPVYAETAPQEKALKIHGLRAVFGEKYPPMVRVVSVGVPVADLLADPTNDKWQQYSIEFCGGTHLGNAGEAQVFAITGEESVSKGIRRIVALTGPAAFAATQKAGELDQAVAVAQKSEEKDIPQALSTIQKLLGVEGLPLRAKRHAQSAVAELQSKYKSWEKSHRGPAAKLDLGAIADNLMQQANDHAGAKIIVSEVQGASNDQVLGIIDSLKKRLTSYGILLASAADGKVNFISVVTDDVITRGLKAGDWVKEAAKVTGGGGGGRPQMAQAGGKDPAKLADALSAARQHVAAVLK